MIQSNIDAIIFDFGGVLINLDYQLTIDAFKSLGVENFDELYSQATQENLFDDIETGTINSDEFVAGLLSYLPHGSTEKDVVAAWNAMILDVPIASVELLQSLKGKYKVFLLSNTNVIHLPHALQQWNKTSSIALEECFDHVYLSYIMGMRKPDREIFDTVCQIEDLNPANTLFIDDSIQHIEGAKQFGLQTHHLESGQSLTELFS